jgi:hypothetical protein
MDRKEKLFSVLQEMENTKLERPVISEITDSNEVKKDLLIMNLLTETIFRISEMCSLLDEYGENIIITTLPITKYDDYIFICKYNLTKGEIISLIKNGEKIIIYNSSNEMKKNDIPNEYRCAIVTTGGNINDNYPIELIETSVIDWRSIRYKSNEFTKDLKPVSWTLIGKHDDGFVLRDSLVKGVERQTLIRIEGNKIIEAFELKPIENNSDGL